MAVVFGNTGKASAAKSVVDSVFERPTVVLDEAEANAEAAAGQVRVITNYRGFTAKGPGRKHALLGQTVVDLSALATVSMADLPNLIERLQSLQTELTDAGL